MKISKIIEIYKENDNYLNSLQLSKIERVKSILFGYLIPLIILLGPAIIVAHFFIYSFYFDLIVAILLFIFLTFISLGEIFTDKFSIYFSKFEGNKNLYITYIIHTIVYFILLVIGYFIIIYLS